MGGALSIGICGSKSISCKVPGKTRNGRGPCPLGRSRPPFQQHPEEPTANV
jgi:hypothetical protein